MPHDIETILGEIRNLARVHDLSKDDLSIPVGTDVSIERAQRLVCDVARKDNLPGHSELLIYCCELVTVVNQSTSLESAPMPQEMVSELKEEIAQLQNQVKELYGLLSEQAKDSRQALEEFRVELENLRRQPSPERKTIQQVLPKNLGGILSSMVTEKILVFAATGGLISAVDGLESYTAVAITTAVVKVLKKVWQKARSLFKKAGGEDSNMPNSLKTKFQSPSFPNQSETTEKSTGNENSLSPETQDNAPTKEEERQNTEVVEKAEARKALDEAEESSLSPETRDNTLTGEEERQIREVVNQIARKVTSIAHHKALQRARADKPTQEARQKILRDEQIALESAREAGDKAEEEKFLQKIAERGVAEGEARNTAYQAATKTAQKAINAAIRQDIRENKQKPVGEIIQKAASYPAIEKVGQEAADKAFKGLKI